MQFNSWEYGKICESRCKGFMGVMLQDFQLDIPVLWRAASTDFQVLLLKQVLLLRMPFPVVILCTLFLLLACYFNLFFVVIVS